MFRASSLIFRRT